MTKRSIKLDGKTTSLFLEDAFWRELENRAEGAGESWTDYLRELVAELEPSANRSAAIKEALVNKLRNDLNQALGGGADFVASRWVCELNGTSQRYSFNKDKLLVGASADCDLSLEGTGVDQKHGLLAHDGERWWAMDCQSSSGIFLNGKKLQVAPVPRQSELRIGDYFIKLV
jgi:predicted DNA-binding ribbon-helix-helix protein